MNRLERREQARLNIGRRCRWADEGATGTIVDVVVVGGGNSCYVVEWDDDAPDWWGAEVSTAHGDDFVVEATR